MNCEKCGSELIYRIQGHSCSWTCPQCGWGIATSYFAPIDLDQTEYIVRIHAVASPPIQMIKSVTRILSCNSIEARNSLVHGTAEFSGMAPIVKKYVAELESAGLQYDITPAFPY